MTYQRNETPEPLASGVENAIDEAGYTLLSDLASIDCYDTNLRDQPEAYAALDRYREACAKAATPAPGAPAGFKLVPIEPTPEMIAAGQEAQNRACYQKPQPVGGEWGAVYYRAMLDAAPGAPGQESVTNSTHK